MTIQFKSDFYFYFVGGGGELLIRWFWAESVLRWGQNGGSPRKTTSPPTSRTWLVSHVTQARLEPTTHSGKITSDLGRYRLASLTHSAIWGGGAERRGEP